MNEKRVIRRISRKLKQDTVNEKPLYRAKELTGLHINTLKKLICEDPKINVNPATVTRSVIYNILIDMFLNVPTEKMEIITSSNLFDKLVSKYDFDHLDIDGFRKLLVKLDFVWKKIDENTVIIVENPVVRFERFEYLNILKRKTTQHDLRIVFVDEIAYNEDMIMDLNESKELAQYPDSSQQRVIYAVDKTLTCIKEIKEFNADIFEDWITNELCASLDAPSVVVIRKEEHHNAKIKETPTLHSTKQELIEWLEHHNVTYDEELSKHELYNLAERYTDSETPLYKIDAILNARGHTLLRLPKYIETTNPATTLLDLMKNTWKEDNLAEMKCTMDLKTCFNCLLLSAEKCLKGLVMAAVIEMQKILKLEYEVDHNLDRLLQRRRKSQDQEFEDSDVPSCSDSE